jgi:hypothetical protein
MTMDFFFTFSHFDFAGMNHEIGIVLLVWCMSRTIESLASNTYQVNK